ncbi:MAG: hypothetical protein RL014_1119 [Pseudomonadota bacterium]|jgi:methyl-accepting chemotaxis protein
MALVKKPRADGDVALASHAPAGVNAAAAREADAQRRRARTLAKQQQASERISAAATELAAGINEASSASEELKRASDQIATGSEEASAAAQESLAALTQVTTSIVRQLQAVNAAQKRAVGMQEQAAEINSGVKALVDNLTLATERQAESVKMVAELERQASNIGDIVKAVARIADQTNLLALNAAIEAARAGKHGKGFAVVADEVRTLAETSEKSAKEIQNLIGQIQGDVQTIAQGINSAAEAIQTELGNSEKVMQQLDSIRKDAAQIVEGATEIAGAAAQSDVAAKNALKGAEEIAAAAAEQGSACEEAAKTVAEQASALAECEQTAQSLSDIADELKNSTDISKSAEEVASAAEELSSVLQEINRSAAQIMVALDQIRKGAEVQHKSTEISAAAVSQIAKGAELAEQRAASGMERARSIETLLAENKRGINALVSGIDNGVTSTKDSIRQIKELELVSRKIDKIVDAITQVSIQTNMLAVNGSIEAARAGEYGKGFVVVATDIRNLAHDSAENADRIKDMVKAIQDQIGLVGRDLNDIVSAAVIEAEKGKAINGNLAKVEADVAEVVEGNVTAQSSAREISTALGQVRAGVDQISAAAQQATKSAEQAAAAAKQQAQGAEELSAAIEEIASLADELQSN